MVTVADVIDRINGQFSYTDTVLPLAAAISSTSATTCTVTDFVPAIGPGDVVRCEREYMLVTAVAGTGPKTLTIVRGWLGSTAATHVIGSGVFVPRVFDRDVMDLINECLDSLYPALYTRDVVTLSYNGNAIGYDLVAAVGHVLAVDAQEDSSAKFWRELKDYRYIPNASTADFPSGKALMIRQATVHAASVRVIYAKPFIRVDAVADDLQVDAGMYLYMTDLPYYYAMSRLLAGEEVDRADSEGASQHQRAQDVQPFQALRTGEWYLARYNDILRNCRDRLAREISSFAIGGYGS